jgi:excisionase family DNA binding protein
MIDDSPEEATTQEHSPPKYLTVRELQHELRISEKLAYRLLQSGGIPSVRIGHVYRIPRRQLEEALLVDPRPFSTKGPPRTLAQ